MKTEEKMYIYSIDSGDSLAVPGAFSWTQFLGSRMSNLFSAVLLKGTLYIVIHFNKKL